MSNFNDEYRADDDPATGSRTWLVIAGVIVVLLVAMTVFVVIANQRNNDEAPEAGPTDQGSSDVPPTTPAADSGESVCGLQGNEGLGSLSSPPDGVTWELIGQTAVPSSDDAGPGVVEDGGIRSCFARTPKGVLLAAANFFAWPEAVRTDPVAVVENNMASGPGYEAALATAKAGTSAPADESLLFQIRGFNLAAYTGDSALVDIAVQASNGVYVHGSFELVWEKGDWRFRLRPDGTFPDFTQLPDLTGYIPWAGA